MHIYIKEIGVQYRRDVHSKGRKCTGERIVLREADMLMIRDSGT
jgi:hypothetical protein